MNKLQKSRELLKKYLENTPKEVLQKKFEKYNSQECKGLTLYQYLDSFDEEYKFLNF